MKVDREAVATLVLPQLWAMSMGPREYYRFSYLRSRFIKYRIISYARKLLILSMFLSFGLDTMCLSFVGFDKSIPAVHDGYQESR